MSVAAVNSALQRARTTMRERLPAAPLEWATAADAEDAERWLLETYMEAWERHDASRLVALLPEDVRMAMPPHPTWYEGRQAVAAFGCAPRATVPSGGGRLRVPVQLADDELIGEFVRRVEGPVNVVGVGAPPLAHLAELGVARIKSVAGVLMSQLYGAHEAKPSEGAAGCRS